MTVRRGTGNRLEVKTVHFQNHAWVRARSGRPRRDLLRYDTNPHRRELHVHLFDGAGSEVQIQPVDRDDMPDLDSFIRHVVAHAGEEIQGPIRYQP